MARCLDPVCSAWQSRQPGNQVGCRPRAKQQLPGFWEESQAELYCCFYIKPRTRLFSSLSFSLASVLDWLDPGLGGKEKGFALLTPFQLESAVWELGAMCSHSDPGPICDGALLVACLGLQMCQGHTAMATGVYVGKGFLQAVGREEFAGAAESLTLALGSICFELLARRCDLLPEQPHT